MKNIFLYNIETKENIREIIKYIKKQTNYIFITTQPQEVYNCLKENTNTLNLKYIDNNCVFNNIYSYIEICTPDKLIPNIEYIVQDYNVIIDDLHSFNLYEKILIKNYLKETAKSKKHKIVLQRNEIFIDDFFKENYTLKNIRNFQRFQIKYIGLKDTIQCIIHNFKNRKRVLIICNSEEDIYMIKNKLKRYSTTNKKVLTLHKHKPYEYIFKKNLLNIIPIVISDESILNEKIIFDEIIIQKDNNVISMAEKIHLQTQTNNKIHYVFTEKIDQDKGDKPYDVDVNDLYNILYNTQKLNKIHLIKYIEYLKEHNFPLTLNNPIKIKYKNYLYTVDRIPFSTYPYDKNGEKRYLFIKSKSYIITNRENNVLHIEKVYFVKKEKNKIVFTYNNKEISAYQKEEKQ